jgi:hypothetical protein
MEFISYIIITQKVYLIISINIYDANDLPKAINHKLFKNSLHMEVHFELLEEKNPLISVDLKPQNSYELSRYIGF